MHDNYADFWVKNVDNFDIPTTLAFFSFSTPCDAFVFFFLFPLLAAPAFATLPLFPVSVVTAAKANSSSLIAFKCGFNLEKLMTYQFLLVEIQGTHILVRPDQVLQYILGEVL
jgi:hypothetical protein